MKTVTVTTHYCEFCDFSSRDPNVVLACEAQGPKSNYKVDQEVFFTGVLVKGGPERMLFGRIAFIQRDYGTHNNVSYGILWGPMNMALFVPEENIGVVPRHAKEVA